MIFQKKIDRAMDWLKEKNKTEQVYNEGYSGKNYGDNHDLEHFDPKAEWRAEQEEKIELEKNDVLAIIISALIVFGPVLLIMIIIAVLAFLSI